MKEKITSHLYRKNNEYAFYHHYIDSYKIMIYEPFNFQMVFKNNTDRLERQTSIWLYRKRN